ncbi:MAG: methylmalonyl-CoA mutase small subunit [bacterium]|nr:MAG: methylmalonyl-CoA mutase small subunit [bacterium]
MEKEKLFTEFTPVAPAEWKEKILHDLKGTDYDKKLVWHTDEGFDVQPFYQQEHIASLKHLQLLPGKFPFVRGKNTGGNKWQINQIVKVKDLAEANKKARAALENGADSLTFASNNPTTLDDKVPEKLLQHIDGEKVMLHFKTAFPVSLLQNLQKFVQKSGWNPEKITGSVYNDPLAYFTLHGEFQDEKPFALLSQSLKAASGLPAFRTITVDGTIFHNAGATTVSEMAFALSVGSYYMQRFTDEVFSADEVAGRIQFSLAVGSDYFMEIAKFRAFRYLWAQILKAYGVKEENAAASVQAVSAFRNKTVYDPYVNMLRTTTETMSAILGGADMITVLPFDLAYETPTEMANRIARNQQLILKEESYFDKVTDPAAGSYYIENLTTSLIEKSWELFLKTDDLGGYLEAFKKGFVQDRIEKEARKKDAGIARRKVSILGVNQFPNITEHIDKAFNPDIFELEKVVQKQPIRPLRIYRAAAAFETLRYATDRFAQKHHRPKVWIFTFGDMAMRRARAQFAENFFGCIGYEILNNPGFTTVEEGIAAAKKEKPEIVVLCSDDKTYEEVALTIFEKLKDETIVVLAGYPEPLVEKLKAEGMKHFIHVRSNVLKGLEKFNEVLQVNNK